MSVRVVELGSASSQADDSLTSLFHRINKILPPEQEVVTVGPQSVVQDALQIMTSRGFSQLPVVEGTAVLGIFSFRSFAVGCLGLAPNPVMASSMAVEDFMETTGLRSLARLTDEAAWHFDLLDQNDAVVVGDPDHLLGILTPIDVLRYLYGVASPFVQLAEIELGLRALIERSAADQILSECIERSLGKTKEGKAKELTEMVFGEYLKLVKENWPTFAGTFGGTVERAVARLDSMRVLRNKVFHFKGDLSPEERETLSEHREWMLRKTREITARATANKSKPVSTLR